MPEYTLTPDDFNLYYDSCYAVRKDGTPVRIKNTDGSRINFVKFPSEEDPGNGYVQWDNWDTKLDVSPLITGAINLRLSVIVINSVSKLGSPWKYRRGTNSRNTNFYDPFSTERAMLRSPQVQTLDDWNILEYWTKPVYPKALDALEQVTSHEYLARAFTERMYFGTKWTSDSIALFKDNRIVGEVEDDTILLRPGAHPLYEQLSEYGLKVRKV